jgi:hypothetical protein
LPLVGLASLFMFFGSGAEKAFAPTCVLDPEVRGFTVNQGLNSHARLVRGKETLVRFYVGLPSCADIANGAYIQVRRGELTVKNGTTPLNQTPLPTSPQTLGSDGSPPTFPNITTAGTPTLADSPADLKFVIPGSVLAQGTTGAAFTATLELKLFYKSAATRTATLPATESNKLLTTIAGSSTKFTKAVDKKTKAVRILAVPLGIAPLPTTASDALQAGMQALTRIFPVPDGTQTAQAVDAPQPTTGGIRYVINGGGVNLTNLTQADGKLCGSLSTWNSIKPQLASFFQAYNTRTANSTNPADRVVGVIDAAASVPSSTNPSCDEGRASTASPEAWVRAVPGVTGGLLGMEVAHTFGAVPSTVSDTAYHATHTEWADWATGDTDRAYNVTDRLFLPRTPTIPAAASPPPVNRPVMKYRSVNWGNDNTLLEAGDYGYGFIGCKLGGTTTTACKTAGTTGTDVGVPASEADIVSSFVLTGTVDASGLPTTSPAFTVHESYVAPTLPTAQSVINEASASPYRLIQKYPGGQLDQGVQVAFDETDHTHEGAVTDLTKGLVSIAYPLANSDVNQVQLVYRSPTGASIVIHTVNKTAAPVISTAPILLGPASAPDGGGSPEAVATTASSGDLLRTITVNPAPTEDDCPHTFDGQPVTVGIAFDGTELLVSCTTTNVITRVDPANGTNLGKITVDIPTSEGIGAISWDAESNKLWAGTALVSSQKVYRVTLDKQAGTGTAEFAFTHTGGNPIIDGLAYDGTDNSLWLSPDVDYTVYHYTYDDIEQQWLQSGSFSVADKLGSCGNSGIAVASTTTLYLANNGCSEIYSSNKDGTAINLFANLSPKRVEDLECDSSTFAGKGALWSKDAYDWELNAFEVPAGQCAEGGQTEPPPTQQTATYTATDADSACGDLKSHLFLKHPAPGGVDVVAVGLTPTSCAAGTATFTYTAKVGCPGCQLIAEVFDQWQSDTEKVADSTLDTFSADPIAAINNPAPDERYFPNDAIVLEGEGRTDANGPLPAENLAWTSPAPNSLFSGTEPGRKVVLQPPNGHWPSGTYDIKLTASNGNRTDSKTVTITVVNDADGDRMTDEFESCLGVGAASDPLNGGLDKDGDKRRNSDERFTQNGPCVAETSYYARDAVWTPDPFDASVSSGSIFVSNISVDAPGQVKTSGISITEINGQSVAGCKPMGAVSSNFVKNVYSAKFEAEPFASCVRARNLRNRSVLVRITGKAAPPATWQWDVYVSPFIK